MPLLETKPAGGVCDSGAVANTSLETNAADAKSGARRQYASANLWHGSGGTPFGLGPLILSSTTQELPVYYVDPANAHSLCGRSLDWIEALAS